MQIRAHLQNLPHFSALTEVDWQLLESVTTLHQAKEGEILFYEGDPTLRVWIVLEGVVEVYKCDPKGNAFVLNRFTPPGFIAEMAVLEGIAYPATGRTCAPSLLAMIDAQLFRDKFLGNPRIAGLMISSLSRKIKQLESRLSILLFVASRGAYCQNAPCEAKFFDVQNPACCGARVGYGARNPLAYSCSLASRGYPRRKYA